VSPPSIFSGRQVVMLASIDWNYAWQRHQAFAAALEAEGAEVFFVENTGFRGFSFSDLSRVFDRFRRLLARAHRRANRRIVSPLVLPPTRRVFRLLNAVYFVPLLLSKLRKRGLRSDPIVFAYLPTETTLQILAGLKPATLVYDCVDNFHGHPTPPPDLVETEKRLLAQAQLVLTTSSFLEDQKKKSHPVVRRIHHGVPESFLRAPLAPLARYQRFCYFGTIWNALDYRAIAALASDGRTVDLIGPTKESAPPLPDGVRILKPVKHDQLPKRLERYDALVLPYADNEYNKGVVPAKLYECLATGKPVLCSALPSLLEFEGLIEIARAPADFAALAERLPSTETESKSRNRIAAAEEHTTGNQIRKVGRELEGLSAIAKSNQASPLAPKTEEIFLRGISWIALWFIIARAVSILTPFIGARFLGPEAFGRAHLVIAVAAILQTAIALGFPLALTRFGSTGGSPAERGRTIATTLICFLLWAGLLLSLTTALSDSLAPLSHLPRPMWMLALALAFLTALHHTIGGALQGMRRFAERGLAEALYSLGALTSFTAAVLLGDASTIALIGSLIAGLALGSLYALAKISDVLKPVFDRRVMREVLPFAVLGTVNIFSVALIQAPGRIAVFHFASPAASGIFSMYFMATLQIALALGNMLQAVLVPIASDAAGQRDAWELLGLIKIPAALFSLAGFSWTTLTATTLMGGRYPVDPLWIALFSSSATLALIHGVMTSVYAARDLSGLLVSVSGSLITGACNAAANFILTPRWGIAGAGAAMLLSYAIGLAWLTFELPSLKERRAR